MITVKYYINPKQKRKDGTMNIKVVITFKRKRKMLPTGVYVTQRDITKKGRLKSPEVMAEADAIVGDYRKRIASLGVGIENMDLAGVVAFLQKDESPDFFKFAAEYIGGIKNESTRFTYENCVRNVRRYAGGSLKFKDMDMGFFLGLEKFLRNHYKGVTAGVTLTMNRLKTIYRNAQIRYNEFGEVVPSYPLIAYHVPKSPIPRQLAIPIEEIRRLKDLPLRGNTAMVRDIYILSFCLMGMNLVDMWSCQQGDKVRYERTKTKNSRKDRAFIEIDIDPRVKPLMERYKGERLMFYFAERYSKLSSFRNMVDTYMREWVSKAFGRKITFYSARHSFATIAYNDCGIDKYTVHSMLNHVSPDMKVTDIYIKRDFTRENEANKRVLDLLFQ